MERIPAGFNEGKPIKIKIRSVEKLRPSNAIEDLHQDCGNNIDWNQLREDFFNECTAIENDFHFIHMKPNLLLNWFKNKIESKTK